MRNGASIRGIATPVCGLVRNDTILEHFAPILPYFYLFQLLIGIDNEQLTIKESLRDDLK